MEAEKVEIPIGRVELVIHQAEAEGIIRRQRSSRALISIGQNIANWSIKSFFGWFSIFINFPQELTVLTINISLLLLFPKAKKVGY